MTKIEDQLRDHLLAVATKFAKAKSLSLQTVSRRVHGHDRFLVRFGDGDVTVTLSKYAEMLQQFASEWPAEAGPMPELCVEKLANARRRVGNQTYKVSVPA